MTFYYDLDIENRDIIIQDYISFLNKSGFSVIVHKQDFVIVASRCHREITLIDDDDIVSFEVNLAEN